MTLADRVTRFNNRLAAAADSAGRVPGDITVVAVSKTFPAAAVLEAADMGVSDFGENRAQELKRKLTQIDRPLRWHFVGRLQTNKVRDVVSKVVLVHSVESFRLAEAIGRRATGAGAPQEVLIEVNTGGKGGIDPAAAVDLAEDADRVDGVSVRGLMTIPAFPHDPEDSRPAYKELADLGAALQERLPGADQLSMGMTRDLEVAIEEGATIVRVGEAIFGPRDR
ncbi:MAG: YggS family pyridoxal phosphate-dependent enzyme [Actinomycetota bacterium]|nr:YggS family pyridoxal phosphate-dependent enzyme [Actinomycetota bacterium]